MPFTDEEFRKWLEARRLREEERPRVRPQPVDECLHCGQSFGFGEGYIGEEISICEICDGD